ncbi:hypothetical protein SynBIOSU31_02488 [Synechococcus sp. BIOS-U3-1]|nr:hypothetical protein SynBIOSU31_02488 [Synechococcus sp. BIOS-U3-1]
MHIATLLNTLLKTFVLRVFTALLPKCIGFVLPGERHTCWPQTSEPQACPAPNRRLLRVIQA